MNNEIVIYQPNESTTKLEVKLEDDTVWLAQSQIVELLNSTKQNISLHIKNIFKEEELVKDSTVKEYLTVQMEGNREVKRKILLYNLDVIISVGYRVKSKRGTQFRIWANKIIKDYLLKGYAINKRINKIEEKLTNHEEKFDLLLNTNLPANEGIFYDGQIFDAWVFVSKIIKSSKKSIILIDNYIDESVLVLLAERNQNVSTTVYTKNISKKLQIDIQKHNQQYAKIDVIEFNKSHDRFLIIDNKTIYHIGASLKDLGKRWFAFSKIDINIKEIIDRLN